MQKLRFILKDLLPSRMGCIRVVAIKVVRIMEGQHTVVAMGKLQEFLNIRSTGLNLILWFSYIRPYYGGYGYPGYYGGGYYYGGKWIDRCFTYNFTNHGQFNPCVGGCY